MAAHAYTNPCKLVNTCPVIRNNNVRWVIHQTISFLPFEGFPGSMYLISISYIVFVPIATPGHVEKPGCLRTPAVDDEY